MKWYIREEIDEIFAANGGYDWDNFDVEFQATRCINILKRKGWKEKKDFTKEQVFNYYLDILKSLNEEPEGEEI